MKFHNHREGPRTLLSRRDCETSNFAKVRLQLYKEGKHPLRGESGVAAAAAASGGGLSAI